MRLQKNMENIHFEKSLDIVVDIILLEN